MGASRSGSEEHFAWLSILPEAVICRGESGNTDDCHNRE